MTRKSIRQAGRRWAAAGVASALLCAALILAPLAIHADESQVSLKAGPGEQLVRGSCLPCHSLDYIQMNSVFMTRPGWEGSVNKMINVFGAPIPKDDVAKIVEYLTQQYGKSG